MQGSCLCGAVRYEADRIQYIQLCHCRTCQKAQGAPYIAGGAVLRSDFRWLSGEHLLSAYESSPGKYRRFCSVCGTPIMSDRESLPHIALRVTTLDEDPGLRPSYHIWTQDDCPWTASSSDLPQHTQWPPEKQT
ncbi:aldehyde-activating protein [Neisseria arctica]|uniref:Aldehyde-activating protein n=1 Tax=Neisseria arctica TaxID=1470200 RepID=A0A0J0YPT4_9NEIS|nr:GFA family protein [Neisseria arctica]KLT72147.1 aldehyde-activating protein [Neisseria arctica]UOO86833.1 GFA family protein [Neisseria arctica]